MVALMNELPDSSVNEAAGPVSTVEDSDVLDAQEADEETIRVGPAWGFAEMLGEGWGTPLCAKREEDEDEGGDKEEDEEKADDEEEWEDDEDEEWKDEEDWDEEDDEEEWEEEELEEDEEEEEEDDEEE